MFVKAKVKLWVAIIIICGLLSQVPRVISHITMKATRNATVTEYSVGIEMDDAELKDRVAGMELGKKDNKIRLSIKNSDQDFIITRRSDKILHEGYEKLSRYLYTPLVMFINKNILSYADGFTVVVHESRNMYMKDIRYLLHAIEEDKTWEDIGINKKMVEKEKDAVTFNIPNEYDDTYQDIRSYFIIALNDFKEPSDAELPDLQSRVDIILDKCIKQEDISGMFRDIPKKGIFMCKESVISENQTFFRNGTLTNPSYLEISPGKTMNIEYDVYIKKDKVDEIRKLMQSVDFLELFGLRNIDNLNTTQSLYYNRCFKVLDAVETTTSMNTK